MNEVRSGQEGNVPSRWPHRVAVLLAMVVFPLIWVGGLVTSYDAGMSVPDWPGTYGYNMFSYPLSTWLYGPFDLFVEHGHRLLGSLAGLIAMVLVGVTFWKEPRKSVRWFSVGLLLMVIAQGVLGGMRVVLDARTLAKIHGCVGPAFFGAVVAFSVVTSGWWWRHGRREEASGGKLAERSATSGGSSTVSSFALLMLVVCYVQLVIGAFVRHVAVDASPQFFRSLVIFHVLLAMMIVLGTIVQWSLVALLGGRKEGVGWSIHLLVGLVFVQFLLGLTTWVVKFGWPDWFQNRAFAAQFVIGEKNFVQMNLVTAHVAVGSLLLAFWVVHWLRCCRVLGPSFLFARFREPGSVSDDQRVEA